MNPYLILAIGLSVGIALFGVSAGYRWGYEEGHRLGFESGRRMFERKRDKGGKFLAKVP